MEDYDWLVDQHKRLNKHVCITNDLFKILREYNVLASLEDIVDTEKNPCIVEKAKYYIWIIEKDMYVDDPPKTKYNDYKIWEY